MRHRNSFLFAIPLVVLLAIALIPYIWIVLASFKERVDLITPFPKWIFEPTIVNYAEIFEKGFDTYLLNSIIIGFSSTALTVVVGTLAAYGFSRFKVPAGNHLFFFILATRLGPPVAYALPMYLIFKALGLVNTHFAVVLAHATFNLVLVVWMMRSFFNDVPREVEEAAYLDGCGHFRVFWRIALPMTYPGLITVSIFVLIFSWNELLFSLILTGGETRTLPVMIPSLVLHIGTLWGQVAAASIIQSIPVLVFIFFIQKNLVQGLTFGAVKG
ncbi:MAG: carbohydrate ABC transporter permease [Gammaproteobacteria bacterium]|nr:carbohydrate ABC transporter permease [Gammaproteobacteria bacterium]MDH3464766.1 carbohydrate ABC transporter permease [Gammaproteobacteria bacterium]